MLLCLSMAQMMFSYSICGSSGNGVLGGWRAYRDVAGRRCQPLDAAVSRPARACGWSIPGFTHTWFCVMQLRVISPSGTRGSVIGDVDDELADVRPVEQHVDRGRELLQALDH